jgi:hypothetical protein
MGVVETSPSVSRRDGEGTLETRQRARPNCLEWARARGLDARLHLLGCTERESCQSCACDRSRLEHRRCRLKQMPRTLAETREKPLQEHSRSCRASGARPAGPLTRPHGKALATRREERPISRLQHLRDPNGNTHRCSGATVEDSPEGPINNQGETRLKPAKNAKHKSTYMPDTHTWHKHGPGGPRGPPRQHSERPSSETHLARGVDTPSGEVRLARGPYAPSGGVRLTRGLSPAPRGPPRSRAERPLGRGPLRSRASARAFLTPPRAHAPARAYGHLML